jgi:16S rRNA (adenine1518-N6/adenine1519-N6)-dimethyltransferase
MTENPRSQLNRLGIRADKSLGQHFLINEGAAEDIVAAALQSRPEGLVEIGPGLGVLTRRLVTAGVPVVAVEMDEDMRPELERIQRDHPNLELRFQDVLRADMSEFTSRGRWVAVGNIPYQITSPLLEQLLTTEPPFEAIVLMIQREVGRRLMAEPGSRDYSALTLLGQFHAGQPEVIAELSPGSFDPPPKVHSVVLRFAPRTPPIEDPERRRLFFRVVRAAFGQRRKQLVNALAGAPQLPVDKDEAREALSRARITTSRRGETLSLDEFVTLTEAVEEVLA